MIILVNCSDLVKTLKDSVDDVSYFGAAEGIAIIRRLVSG